MRAGLLMPCWDSGLRSRGIRLMEAGLAASQAPGGWPHRLTYTHNHCVTDVHAKALLLFP
jgi:hypothetical protein